MKKLLFIFSLLATWLLVSNTYAQTVEEIEFTITNKEVVGAAGSRPWLELSGKHDIYGKITICLEPYHGAYKTYDVYHATLGKLTLTGSASWSQEGNMEILEANLSTADFNKNQQQKTEYFISLALTSKRKPSASISWDSVSLDTIPNTKIGSCAWRVPTLHALNMAIR